MKRIIILILFIASFSSCKSSKSAKDKTITTKKIITKKHTYNATVYNDETFDDKTDSEVIRDTESTKSKAYEIIDYAKQFEGVRYKWGGTSDAGMDCSGLVYESFRAHDVILPRISRDMAKQGDKIPLKKVQTGDLLFFVTQNRRNAINHVGLIVAIRNNDIEFIHATTGNGVIISRLNETYWLNAFKEARRIL